MKDVIFWSGGGLVARTRQSGGGYQKGTMSELQAIEVPGLPAVVVGAGAPVPWKADALARLPVGPADTDPFWRLAAAFLGGCQHHEARQPESERRGAYRVVDRGQGTTLSFHLGPPPMSWSTTDLEAPGLSPTSSWSSCRDRGYHVEVVKSRISNQVL